VQGKHFPDPLSKNSQLRLLMEKRNLNLSNRKEKYIKNRGD
jgi:hypothetical protein